MKLLSFLGILVLSIGGGSQLNASFILNLSESGAGSVSENGGAFVADTGVLSQDPTNPNPSLVLTFKLPELVAGGSVDILAADGITVSDVLTFTNASGSLFGGINADRLIFYSLDQNGLPADTPAPGTNHPSVAIEHADGTFTWAPGGNVYNGSSDASASNAPEPSYGAMLLMGACLVGLCPLVRRALL